MAWHEKFPLEERCRKEKVTTETVVETHTNQGTHINIKYNTELKD